MLRYDETGSQRRQNLGGAKLTLSELHGIIEDAKGVQRGTIKWLCDTFRESTQYIALSASTKKDYEYCKAVLVTEPTKLKKTFGELPLDKISPPLIQRLIDKIAQDTPSKAAHVLRYVRRVFRWGAARGYCDRLIVEGIEAPKEEKIRRMPTDAAYKKILAFTQERGQRQKGEKGACPQYLWIVCEIAYLCRLRGIEVDTLTDANASAEGVLSNRRKGSRDNITEWNPRLKAAWDAAVAYRTSVWAKRKYPIPLKAEDLPLFVSTTGTALKKSALDTSWQRFITMALDENIIEPEERFSLHGLKRKGITDTPGTRAEKMDASGHRSAAMLDIYDQSVPRVPAAKK